MADKFADMPPKFVRFLLVALDPGKTDSERGIAIREFAQYLTSIGSGGYELVERIATPPLTEEDMKLIFDAGRQAERATIEQHRGAAAPTPFFSNNGLGNVGHSNTYGFDNHDRVAGCDVFNGQRWVDIANCCVAYLNRIPNRHHGFVEGMSDQLAYGTISGKQAKYLHSLFRQYL